MSHSKRHFLCLPVFLLAALGAAACSPGSASSSVLSTAAPPAIQVETLPTNEAGVPIIARVNEAEITLPQYQRMVERNQQAFGGGTNAAHLALQTLIQQSLIDQAAAQFNITVSAEEVEQEFQGLMTSAGGGEAWQQWLASNSYTEDELRATLRETLLTSRVRDRITGDLSQPVLQAHARHILVATQDEANQLLVRLQSGEDFAALAAQYSLDSSSSSNGGDLGWFTSEELLEPTLSQIAFQLQPGQIAGPIQTSLGYHIIQMIEIAQREIDPEKRAQLGQSRFESWLNTLTASATIEQYL